MKITTTCPVDAGNISILDCDWVIEKGGYIPDDATVINQEPGLVTLEYNIQHPYLDDDPKGEDSLTIGPSGKMVISDACYLFKNHETWLKILNDTDYLKNLGCHGFSVNTGGDGFFDISLKTKDHVEDPRIVAPYLPRPIFDKQYRKDLRDIYRKKEFEVGQYICSEKCVSNPRFHKNGCGHIIRLLKMINTEFDLKKIQEFLSKYYDKPINLTLIPLAVKSSCAHDLIDEALLDLADAYKLDSWKMFPKFAVDEIGDLIQVWGFKDDIYLIVIEKIIWKELGDTDFAADESRETNSKQSEYISLEETNQPDIFHLKGDDYHLSVLADRLSLSKNQYRETPYNHYILDDVQDIHYASQFFFIYHPPILEDIINHEFEFEPHFVKADPDVVEEAKYNYFDWLCNQDPQCVEDREAWIEENHPE